MGRGIFLLHMAMVGVALSCAAPEPERATRSIDWSSIPTQTIDLFYPAQSSYEWLRSERHGDAGEEVAAGEACRSCHEGEERTLGDQLVAGEILEPMPVAGKPGMIGLRMQVAYDAENAYFRFRWRTRNPYPGEAHPFYRFDGRHWSQFGGSKLDAAVRAGEQPGIYEDRLSMLIDDGSVPDFEVHGCWITCHEGSRDMPGRADEAAVRAHPVLGDAGLKRSDVRKYLPSTRTASSWASTKSSAEIARIMARGGFLDLIQWRAHRSNPVGMADDFYVLEYRLMDAGQGPFQKNWDPEGLRPRYSYDPARRGGRATRLERIRNEPTALVHERNAIAFDTAWSFAVGDLVPAYVTSRVLARGSAANSRNARGQWRDGVWTLVWSRSLYLENPDDKGLREGGAYSFGFAVHDDNIGSRGHYVSWPLTVGLGAQADVEATRLP